MGFEAHSDRASRFEMMPIGYNGQDVSWNVNVIPEI